MGASKRELLDNCERWIAKAKEEGLPRYGIGAIFIFFNLDDPEGNSAVAHGTVDREAIKRHCEGILKKLSQGSLIINPFAQ